MFFCCQSASYRRSANDSIVANRRGYKKWPSMCGVESLVNFKSVRHKEVGKARRKKSSVNKKSLTNETNMKGSEVNCDVEAVSNLKFSFPFFSIRPLHCPVSGFCSQFISHRD